MSFSEFTFSIATKAEQERTSPAHVLVHDIAAARTSVTLSQPGEPLLLACMIIHHSGTGSIVLYKVTEATPATSQQWETCASKVQELLTKHRAALETQCRNLMSGRRAKLCTDYVVFATVGLAPLYAITPGFSPAADALVQQYLDKVRETTLKRSLTSLAADSMTKPWYHGSCDVMEALPSKGPFELSDDAAIARDFAGHRGKLYELSIVASPTHNSESAKKEKEEEEADQQAAPGRDDGAESMVVLVMQSAQIKELMHQCDNGFAPRPKRLLEFLKERTLLSFPYVGIMEICQEESSAGYEDIYHILALEHPQEHLALVRRIENTDAFIRELSEAKWNAQWEAKKRAEEESAQQEQQNPKRARLDSK